jgi:hypothetical protein
MAQGVLASYFLTMEAQMQMERRLVGLQDKPGPNAAPSP